MVDSDGDGTLTEDEVIPAGVWFGLYDADLNPLCTIVWDASGAVPIDPASLSARGDLYRAWSVDLADGISDCNAVSRTLYGSIDLREAYEGLPFAFAIGESISPGAWLQSHYPADYPTDIQPFAWGLYATFDGVEAHEVGYGYLWDVDDCSVVDPAANKLLLEDAEEGRIGLYEGYGLFAYPLLF